MPVTIPAHRADPSGTKTLRESYRRHLHRPLTQLITDLRRAIIDEDVFGLRVDVLQADDLPPPVRFDRDQRKQDAFRQWLRDRLEAGLLEQVDRGQNTFIRSAYARGLTDATRMIRAAGGDAPREDAAELIGNFGVHRRALEQLYAANYEDLEDITAATAEAVGEALAEGFARGEGPRDIARRLTDRIDAIGKTRATTLARTRVIDAHAEATLNRYERQNVGGVTPRAEVLTADDERVCPICKTIDGAVYTVNEAREATFEFEPGDEDEDVQAGTYPVRPPIHPSCRCTLLPVVE